MAKHKVMDLFVVLFIFAAIVSFLSFELTSDDRPVYDSYVEVVPERFAVAEPFVQTCLDLVKWEADLKLSNENGPYEYVIEEYQFFNDRESVKNYIEANTQDSRTPTHSQIHNTHVCEPSKTYVVFRLSFEYQGTNSVYEDDYSWMYACDSKGELVRLKAGTYSC